MWRMISSALDAGYRLIDTATIEMKRIEKP
jgi:diketogulonate reductase-like aldo/keto reductase